MQTFRWNAINLKHYVNFLWQHKSCIWKWIFHFFMMLLWVEAHFVHTLLWSSYELQQHFCFLVWIDAVVMKYIKRMISANLTWEKQPQAKRNFTFFWFFDPCQESQNKSVIEEAEKSSQKSHFTSFDAAENFLSHEKSNLKFIHSRLLSLPLQIFSFKFRSHSLTCQKTTKKCFAKKKQNTCDIKYESL